MGFCTWSPYKVTLAGIDRWVYVHGHRTKSLVLVLMDGFMYMVTVQSHSCWYWWMG